jgi:hypothetical protein
MTNQHDRNTYYLNPHTYDLCYPIWLRRLLTILTKNVVFKSPNWLDVPQCKVEKKNILLVTETTNLIILM